MDGREVEKNILNDMCVELTEEFNRNFQRKAFFTDKWKNRKNPKARGSLLLVSGAMRRSIRSEVTEHGVRFSSPLPYTTVHNEGGKYDQTVKSHSRTNKKMGKKYLVHSFKRKINMPQRQFIGDGKETQQLIRNVVEYNLKQFNISLIQMIKR